MLDPRRRGEETFCRDCSVLGLWNSASRNSLGRGRVRRRGAATRVSTGEPVNHSSRRRFRCPPSRCRRKRRAHSGFHAWRDRRRGWDRKTHDSEARYADETSGKVTNRVVVGNAETTTPSAAPDAPSKPLAKPAKPEKASAPKSAQAVAVAGIGQAAPPEGGKQPVNPLWRAIGELFGARASPAKQTIDSTPTTLTRWACPTDNPKNGGGSDERSQATQRQVCVRAQRIYNSSARGPR